LNRLGASTLVKAVSTAVPPYRLTQDEAARLIEQWLSTHAGKAEVSAERISTIFRNAGVEERYTVLPPAKLLRNMSFGARNRIYVENAKLMGRKVLERLFDDFGVDPAEIDLLITTSCTGFMIPSVDAYLMNLFPFRRDVRRLPITELGCASAAASLGMAHNYIAGRDDATVLVLAIEMCSLNFQPTDTTADHIISTAIFGDGAAAAVITTTPGPGLHITDTTTLFFPGTTDFMGFDVRNTGFHIFLSRRIPEFLHSNIRPAVEEFLRAASCSPGDIDAWLMHPGGGKILQSIERALGLNEDDTRHSRAVLRRFGNLSSATILFILEDYIREAKKKAGSKQVIGAVGPGFQMELSLGQWIQ